MPVQPGLLLALANPAGNVDSTLDTISLADLAAALGLSAQTSQRRVDARIYINGGIADNDNLGLTALVAVERFSPVDNLAKQIAILAGAGVATPVTFRLLDGKRSWQINSAAGAGAFTRISMQPWAQGNNSVDFRDTFRGVVATPGAGVPGPEATVYMSWLRKSAAADATSARQLFGWGGWQVQTTSGAFPRCGLIGDGLVGFRYGSVNCPDGGVGAPAPENGAADIDANAVQPADLVTPAANWWHTAIKIVPPQSPAVGGQWAAYHNGALVALFTQVANFPRGENPGAGPVATPDYTHAQLFSYLGTGANPVVHYDTRYVITDDVALGPTLTF